MTQDNGWDVPDENYRLFRIFDGVSKLLANAQFVDAYAMVKGCRDEFAARCNPNQRDPYAPRNTCAVSWLKRQGYSDTRLPVKVGSYRK